MALDLGLVDFTVLYPEAAGGIDFGVNFVVWICSDLRVSIFVQFFISCFFLGC